MSIETEENKEGGDRAVQRAATTDAFVYRLIITAFFAALGIVTSFFLHSVPQGGLIMTPLHFAVLFCGLVCGARFASVLGAALPFISTAVIGMPVLYPVCIYMSFELCAYGAAAGLLYPIFTRLFRKIFSKRTAGNTAGNGSDCADENIKNDAGNVNGNINNYADGNIKNDAEDVSGNINNCADGNIKNDAENVSGNINSNATNSNTPNYNAADMTALVVSLALSMLIGRAVSLIVQIILLAPVGQFAILTFAVTSFLVCWPGIVVQIVAIPLITAALRRAGLLPLR